MLKYLVPDLQRSKVESEVVPSLERLVLVDNAQGRISLSDLKAAAPIVDVFDNSSAERSLLDRQLDANEIVNIQFTSGTTSMPKAACLSHRSILNNGNSIGVSDCLHVVHAHNIVTHFPRVLGPDAAYGKRHRVLPAASIPVRYIVT